MESIDPLLGNEGVGKEEDGIFTIPLIMCEGSDADCASRTINLKKVIFQ